MENIKLKIREHYADMSKGDKKISDFVLKNTKDCISMTAVEIANASGVSSASVIRYVKKLGLDGLENFKQELVISTASEDKNFILDPIISQDDTLDMMCSKMQTLVNTAFQDFFYQLDKEALGEAISAVKNARRIYLTGIGASFLPAYDFFHKLKRADFNASCYLDVNMMMEFLNYVKKEDIIVAFSYSGQSKEIINIVKTAKAQGAKVIIVTRNHISPLSKLADICLFIPDVEEVMRIGAFTSLQNSLMMVNLLYLGVIQENLEEIEIELVKTRKMVEGLKEKN